MLRYPFKKQQFFSCSLCMQTLWTSNTDERKILKALIILPMSSFIDTMETRKIDFVNMHESEYQICRERGKK